MVYLLFSSVYKWWGPSGGKNRSALRPFLTSPLRAPTLFDIAAPRSTIFLRSTLRPFFASALRAPTLFWISAPRSDLFASALRAPTYKYEKSALRAPTYFTHTHTPIAHRAYCSSQAVAERGRQRTWTKAHTNKKHFNDLFIRLINRNWNIHTHTLHNYYNLYFSWSVVYAMCVSVNTWKKLWTIKGRGLVH